MLCVSFSADVQNLHRRLSVQPGLGRLLWQELSQDKPQQCRVEEQDLLPSPADQPSFDVAWDTGGFTGLSGHVIHSCLAYSPPVPPKFFFSRAVLPPFILQFILVVGVAITQMQGLGLRFAESQPGPLAVAYLGLSEWHLML